MQSAHRSALIHPFAHHDCWPKFSPDACLGLIKRKFRQTDVSSLDDLARVVKESLACNICQLVGAQNCSTIVPSRDWAGFLSSHFLCLDGGGTAVGWLRSAPQRWRPSEMLKSRLGRAGTVCWDNAPAAQNHAPRWHY